MFGRDSLLMASRVTPVKSLCGLGVRISVMSKRLVYICRLSPREKERDYLESYFELLKDRINLTNL